MTEAEWLAATDPTPMLRHLLRVRDERKLRLFGCSCVRQVWSLLDDGESRRAVEVSEKFADGEVSKCDLDEAVRFSCDASERLETYCISSLPKEKLLIAENKWIAAEMAWKATVGWYEVVELSSCSVGFGTNVLELLRDIFGNPFRPITINPSWLTSTATALAQQMYDSRDFTAMPILADALQDAGCDSEDVLNHCRSEGVHIRGCFVVDLILGKG
jgi:hypothetical protein